MRRFFTMAASIFAFAAPAHAATFAGTTPGPDSTPIPGTELLRIDFEAPNSLLSEIQGLSGNGQIVSGFLTNVYAAPFGDTTKYLSVPVRGSSGTAVLDLTGYDFDGTVDGFSFYWGSIDKYNALKIVSSAGTLNFAFNGVNPNPPPADGSQMTSSNNRRVFFSLAPGETLDRLEFTSNGYAFEVDDIVFTGTSAVPEPAAWAMMIGGFGLVGGAMRRRRSTAATVAA